jgi:hypothetical protein
MRVHNHGPQEGKGVDCPECLIGECKLHELRQFGPCQKCGGIDIYVQFHDAKPHCRECGILKVTPESCKTFKCEETGEHLRVNCRRCQFAWYEKPGTGSMSRGSLNLPEALVTDVEEDPFE